VNATGRNTVEVRFFQGTHDFATFCASLEFIYALYEYTKDCSYKKLTVDDFLAWLGQRHVGNQYRNLLQILSDSVLSDNTKRKFKLTLKRNRTNLNTSKKGK
jgi:tRNA U38,U39,U40 pseudouridine synthase TruA